MKSIFSLTTVLALLAACSSTPSQSTGSSSESALSVASSIHGTWALEGVNELPYTSFQLLDDAYVDHQYFATGICPAVSWGVDCSQAPAYSGTWSVKGETLAFTGDIKTTFGVTLTSERLHLTDPAGHETEYKRESSSGHFKQGQICADMYGNPLGTCDGGDSWACTYVGPGSNDKVCAPDN